MSAVRKMFLFRKIFSLALPTIDLSIQTIFTENAECRVKCGCFIVTYKLSIGLGNEQFLKKIPEQRVN